MKSREIIFTTILSVLVYFAFSPQTRAACDSPDQGCPGGNLAEGHLALANLTNGTLNTAVGWISLKSVTTGSLNTGLGAGTLVVNSGNDNTATGAAALLLNTTGTDNTANGTAALVHNATGDSNTAMGAFALNSNTNGGDNTAIGVEALFMNTSGGANTASGVSALHNNINGTDNTAIGWHAMFANTDGSANTAIGERALNNNMHGLGNTAIGDGALLLATGSGNTALGVGAGGSLLKGNNNIEIGNVGVFNDANTIRLGDSGHDRIFIPAINNIVLGAGVPVIIDSTTGLLGIATSSLRFKQNIKPMDKSSEAILALKPVTFRYNQKIEPKGIPQFGLVAEDVEKVNPDLVVRDKEGKPYSVRYEQVNAMLLNEFLKEHRKNQEQEKIIAQLKSGMIALAATVKEQATEIQKVSAQLEASKPAPQVVNNP